MLNCSRIMVPIPLKLSPPATMASNRRRNSLKLPLAIANNINSSGSGNQQRIDTDNLRAQLDQLHAEAETTSYKVNNARLRLMRLSEAAENLQKRAATTVLIGKETEARELLVQKKRLMQALEKSKNRIDVLDKLAVKINEAISLKETQLIGNVAMYPEFTHEEPGQQVRFVNPKEDNHEDSNATCDLDEDFMKTGQHDEQETDKCEENLHVDWEQLRFQAASGIDTSNHDNLASNLNGISSFVDFLQSVDGKLQQVESDLVMFLRLSTLILENEQKKMNAKVQQTSRLLEDIRNIRERVVSITKAQAQIDGEAI